MIRYEPEADGDLVSMDVKKLGRIPADGSRAHGRAGGHRDRTARFGYDHLHSVVDDHSRLACCEVLPDERATTCAAFLTRALDYAAHGIPTVTRLITDSAWAYHRSFKTVSAQRAPT